MNPFKYVSKTFYFAVAAAVASVALLMGWVTEGDLNHVAAVAVQISGIFGVLIDRTSKGDINLLGVRK